jgi:uncharacterized protein YndB with AHSA1/START domain
MSETTFVYKTYIHTTPEQLWQALTDPAFTSRYWNLTFDTDWQAGSKMVWHNHGVTIDDAAQVVLESEPYTRLSYTWHSFVPGLGTPIGLDADALAECNAEPRSTATFDIEPQGERVKLTVTHDGFPPGSRVIQMISNGWPVVLSNLKTMLETGEVLPTG